MRRNECLHKHYVSSIHQDNCHLQDMEMTLLSYSLFKFKLQCISYNYKLYDIIKLYFKLI